MMLETKSYPVGVMMVVPQYPYPVVGGLERQAHELAKALLEAGILVQVLSGRVKPEQASQETVEGVLVHRIHYSNLKCLRFLRAPFDIMRVLYFQRNTYDVIHSHQHSWFGLFTIVAARILRKPILTKLPNVGMRGIPGLLARRFSWVRKSVLLKSDAVIAMSSESISELKSIGFSSGRILATPNGIQLDTNPRLRKQLKNLRGECRVVFVGRLIQQKNIDSLLYAWRKVVATTGKAAVLELWGSGPLDSDLKHLSHELHISDSVIFRGYVEDVRNQLPKMDVFVLPSYAEGNSNAVLEAMAAGLPIVSTRVGGTPMLVGYEGTDYLCKPGDVEGMATTMLKLIRSRKLRIRVGLAMRRRVECHFDIGLVAQTYAAAYRFLSIRQYDRVKETNNPVIMENL